MFIDPRLLLHVVTTLKTIPVIGDLNWTSEQPVNLMKIFYIVYITMQWMCWSAEPHLQNVEVTLIVLSKGVLASSEAVEEQHAKAEDICAVPLTGVPPAAGYQLLWCLPPTTATCHHQTTTHLSTSDRDGSHSI